MRVTNAYAFEKSINSLQKRQQALTEAQEQLTSGKRVRRASDDPAAAATAERALAAQSRAEAQMRALDASKNAMQLTESALGTAGELMQQARELLVSAGNGSYTDSERATIALAIRGLRDELLSVSNRTDGAGRYLFGGQGADSPPLVTHPAAWSTTPPLARRRRRWASPRRWPSTAARPGCRRLRRPRRAPPIRCST